MNHLYAEALAMRKAGRSYNEINKKFGIAKSTLSNWFKGMPLSARAKERLESRVAEGTLHGLVKRNRMQTVIAQRRAGDIRKRAAQEILEAEHLSDLFAAGLMLYWAEGYKRPKFRDGRQVTNHPISFTNSDPEMVKVFVRFLVEEMKIPRDKIKAHVRIFSHISHTDALNHWVKASGISASNFLQSTVVVSGASKGIRPYNRLPFGTIQIYVADTDQFHRLMGWLDGAKKRLRGGVKKGRVLRQVIIQ